MVQGPALRAVNRLAGEQPLTEPMPQGATFYPRHVGFNKNSRRGSWHHSSIIAGVTGLSSRRCPSPPEEGKGIPTEPGQHLPGLPRWERELFQSPAFKVHRPKQCCSLPTGHWNTARYKV